MDGHFYRFVMNESCATDLLFLKPNEVWVTNKAQIKHFLDKQLKTDPGLSLLQNKDWGLKKYTKWDSICLIKSSEIVFIFIPAFYLIIWLMTSPKNFEKIAILKIWQLFFFKILWWCHKSYNQVKCRWKDEDNFWTFY